MAPEIERITNTFLSNPARVEVARQASASETITQGVVHFKPSRKDRASTEKRNVLRAIIESEGDGCTNAIIFCNRKVDVDIVAKSLKKHGHDANPIHGDLEQSMRMKILNGFRDGELKLLVASDVAARGLDIPNVSHVFNFDVPIHAEDYVHRIGRTGRAGRKGKSITLCTPAAQKHLDAIESLVKTTIPRMDNPLKPAESVKPEPKPKAEKPKAPRRDSPKTTRNDPPKATGSQPKPAKSTPRGGRSTRRHDSNAPLGFGDTAPAFFLQEFRVKDAGAAAEPKPEVPAQPAIETPAPVESAPEKPKRKSRAKAKAPEQPAAEEDLKEKPKRKPCAKAKAPVEPAEATKAEQPAPEPAKEKPKRKPRTKAKAPKAKSEPAPEATPAPAADLIAAAPEPLPKPVKKARITQKAPVADPDPETEA